MPTIHLSLEKEIIPVKGLKKATVLSYLDWLSEKTGHTCRLPNASEARKLHASAHKTGARENTLNYWAGYEITRDEVADFYKKVEKVKQGAYQSSGKLQRHHTGRWKSV